MKRLTDKEYKFFFERVPRLCLDFIVVKDGKILLGRRDIEPAKGLWTLPGGMIYKSETIEKATERILVSETGLKPVLSKNIGFMEFLSEINKDGQNVHSVSIVFLVKLKGGEVSGSSQAKELKFFGKLPKDSHPLHKKFIKNNWLKICKKKF